MKKAIWILFIVVALIWTALAWTASGLARWTSDAIASGANRGLAQTTGAVTSTVLPTPTPTSTPPSDVVTNLTDRVNTTVIAPVNEAVGAAKGAIAGLGANVSANLPPVPALPPVPEWVNQWLGPEWVKSMQEWGAWAKAAAGASLAPNTSTVNPPAAAPPAVAATNDALRNQAAEVANTASAKATQLAEQTRASAVAAAPWLASIVGWLVPIVWIIWGIGLLVGFVATLVLQWGVGRLLGRTASMPS